MVLEVIGASKLDEKILEEIKKQGSDNLDEDLGIVNEIDETISNVASGRNSRYGLNESKESFQTTLAGEEEDMSRRREDGETRGFTSNC